MLSLNLCRLGAVSRCTNYLDRIRPLFVSFKGAFSSRSMRIEVVNKFTDRRVLDLESSDTISTLKARIMDEFHLSDEAMKQRLLIPDKRGLMNINQPVVLKNARDLLEDEHGSSTTLESCSIEENEILCLGWKVPFTILAVDCSSRKEYPIKVNYNDTRNYLINKIVLVAKLKSRWTAFSTLHVSYTKMSNPIFSVGYYSMQPDDYDAPQHRIYLNRVNARLGYKNFNADIQKTPTKLQIFAEIPNFPIKLIPIVVCPSHLFLEIKIYVNRLISNKFGLRAPLGMQRFAMCFEGKLIGEKATVDEVGIKHMDSVQLFHRDPFQIGIVCLSHKGNVEGSYTVRLRCFDTVGKLKEKIQDVTGVPKKEQRLKYDGWCLDNEERSLEFYGIYWRWWEKSNGCLRKEPEAGFKIHLHQEPTFNSESETWKSLANKVLDSLREHIKLGPSISPRGKSLQIAVEVPHMQQKIPLDVNPRDSIGSVIRAIINQVNVLGGHARITEGAVVLAFGSKVIGDESITLDEYGIKHTDSVQLLEKALICFKVIKVGDKKRETIFVEMRCFDTIGSLKERIELVTGIPKEVQKVDYVQEPLKVNMFLDDEKKRLIDYGIHLFDNNWNRCGKNHKIRVAATRDAIGYFCLGRPFLPKKIPGVVKTIF